MYFFSQIELSCDDSKAFKTHPKIFFMTDFIILNTINDVLQHLNPGDVYKYVKRHHTYTLVIIT